MFTRDVKLYNTKRLFGDNYKYVFPEEGIVDKENAAICISGGGMRSLVCANGYFTFLNRYNLLDNISYLSSVSGGSWFSGIYTFSDIYFGDYKNPEDLTMFNLYASNFNNAFFVPNVCVNISITQILQQSKNRCSSLNKIWIEAVNKCILNRFGLFDKVCVESMERAIELNTKYNTDRYIAPLLNRPFWICCSAILANNGNVTIAMTPMYTGLPKTINYKEYSIGNYYIETSGFGCLFDEDSVKFDKTVSIFGFNEFRIADMMGTSSAAFAELVDILNEDGLFIYSQKLKHIVPQYTIANFTNKIEYVDVNIVDGERSNNTAILPLLARGCKKICMFNNNIDLSDGIDVLKNPLSYYCNTCLLELFGMCDNNCYFYPRVNDKVQVFETKYWQLLYDQFQQCIENGGPVYCHVKIPVMENKHNAIKGGYDVELLIYLLYPSELFLSRLNHQIRSEIRKDGIFENFPTYKTMFQNIESVLELSREQINLLHYYTQWCLEETKDIIIPFLKNK